MTVDLLDIGDVRGLYTDAQIVQALLQPLPWIRQRAGLGCVYEADARFHNPHADCEMTDLDVFSVWLPLEAESSRRLFLSKSKMVEVVETSKTCKLVLLLT